LTLEGIMDENDDEEDFYEEMVLDTEQRIREANYLYGPRNMTPSPSFGRPFSAYPIIPNPGSIGTREQGYLAGGPVVHEGFVPQEEETRYETDGGDQSEVTSHTPRYGAFRDILPPDHELSEDDEDEEVEDDEDTDMDEAAFLNSTQDIADPDFDPSEEDTPGLGADDVSISESQDDAESVTAGQTTRGGRQGPRRGGRGRGRGGPKRGWRAILKRLESPSPPRRVPKGEGIRGRSRPKGPRAAAEPSIAFKRLQAQATEAFLERNDFETALEYARRAVQDNPEIFAAHSLLSEVLLAMDRKEESVGALLSGAHTKRDPKLWWQVADRTLELGAQGDREALLGQAYYCFTQVMRLDPTDYEARAERLKIQLDLRYTTKAKRECESMLRMRPHDMDVLRQLAELYTSTGEAAKAKKLYDEAIERLTKQDNAQKETFTWSMLNVYLDLLDHVETSETGISRLRSLSRWLLGRQEEAFWDAQEDDREWDVEDTPRRVEVADFVPGKYPAECYGKGLPLEIRIKLGLLRLKSGDGHLREALVSLIHASKNFANEI
jgi:general transcription factor 3C polypeptide 3 (transcription factor C subunit 4)